MSRRATVVMALLLGCGGSSPTTSTTTPPTETPTSGEPAAVYSREPTENELRAIAELAKGAERIRGLRFSTPVPVLVKNRDAITQYVESQIEEDAITRGRVLYVALGLLPADMDVRAQLLQLLGEQILGYYDAEQKYLVVRDDIMHALGTHIGQSQQLEEARLVLVHELVHALQDQHLKLSVNIDRERTSDAENAFRSLIEGDATLAMFGYILDANHVPLRQVTSDPEHVREIAGSEGQDALSGGAQLANAPPILRIPLLSAYRDGLRFCAYAHGRGGWTAVDLAHDSPPLSTEHVLHPEKWSAGQLPDAVDIGELPAFAEAGLELVETTTIGELETSIYFELGQPQTTAQRAAAGWGGDQIRVYRNTAGDSPGDTPLVWFTSWDDRREAVEAEAAAQLAVHDLDSVQRSLQRVHRVGRGVLILRHVPQPLHAALMRQFTSWANHLPGTPPTARPGT